MPLPKKIQMAGVLSFLLIGAIFIGSKFMNNISADAFGAGQNSWSSVREGSEPHDRFAGGLSQDTMAALWELELMSPEIDLKTERGNSMHEMEASF